MFSLKFSFKLCHCMQYRAALARNGIFVVKELCTLSYYEMSCLMKYNILFSYWGERLHSLRQLFSGYFLFTVYQSLLEERQLLVWLWYASTHLWYFKVLLCFPTILHLMDDTYKLSSEHHTEREAIKRKRSLWIWAILTFAVRMHDTDLLLMIEAADVSSTGEEKGHWDLKSGIWWSMKLRGQVLSCNQGL